NVHMKLELALDEDSIFYKLGSSGLITFSDYIFLLTVLSTYKKWRNVPVIGEQTWIGFSFYIQVSLDLLSGVVQCGG
ncbi:hypothetical protein L9F63_018461, partial [Diploptera punctata]